MPPVSGALFGAYVNPIPDGSQSPLTVSALEAAAGRKFDVNRVYALWDTPEPNGEAKWDVANGIIPLISIDTYDALGPVPWSTVASGADDATIVAQAEGLASLHAPVLLAFDHEPEIQNQNGTATAYVDAWRHYVTLVRQYASNVSFVLIMTAPEYDHSSVTQWYPGDAYVDWLGADVYNHDACGSRPTPWETFSTIASSFNSFAVAHHKPAVVAEWASAEDPTQPGRKAAWITAAGQSMESWPQIKAASYLDAYGPVSGCDWPLTSSASAMKAFADLGAQLYFKPRPAVALAPATSDGPAPLTVNFDTNGTAGTLHPIVSYALNFGDGTSSSGSGPPPASVSHTYLTGDFSASLSVSDAVGQTDTASADVLTAPPTITGDWAQVTSTTTANIMGGIDPNGLDTKCRFEWGTTPSLGASSTLTDAGAGEAIVHLQQPLTGLAAGTVYYWRFEGQSAAGTTVGPTKSFKTAGHLPAVSSLNATAHRPLLPT